MKRLIPFLVLLAGTAGAFAQGTVFFNNNNLTLPEDAVRAGDGSLLLGSEFTSPATYVAQLYWSTDGGTSFTAHTGAASRFRPAGVNPAGTWVGGNRTLPAGVGGVGNPVTLQVRAWDSAGGTLTYDQAIAQGRAYGSSANFIYTQALSVPPAAADTWMVNFQGFSLVPEPSVIGLAMVGAGALFMLRRRK
jgi:hypothetical protein